MMETFTVRDVEIFSVGKWNDTTITQEHLQDMVVAFNETKVGWRPPLKLGHTDKQKILQEDGMPAAGWIDRVYIRGGKLLADFTDIPKKIYELLKAKAYRKVSCEVYWGVAVGEKKYSALLGAVALLGADKPGVMNLADIISNYKKAGNGELSIYTETANFDFEEKNFESSRKDEPMSKTENEIKLETQLQASQDAVNELKAQFSKFTKDAEAKDKEIADLKAKNQAHEAKQTELQAAAAQAKVAKFSADLSAAKLISPAMKPLVEQLVGPEKSEYAFGDKKLSKEDALKELLTLQKKSFSVNLEERSEKGGKASKDGDATDEDAKLDKEIRKRMAENKTSYSTEYKSVMAERAEQEDEEEPETEE